ncbi:MAG TPA: class I SAM-dependent methyltransferase [Dehalococcoidia bacterium]|nr:class I SAM-dependent methyltransferase [Dehalococcoidia bacterium]
MENTCYLCGRSNLKIIQTKLRHGIKRNVLKCAECGLVFLENKERNLREYYEKDYRKLYSPVINQEVSPAERFEIYLPFQKSRIEDIRPYLNPDMKALDIGCSSGYFLYALKDLVQECVGIELNKDDVEFARKKCGVKVYNRPLEKTDVPLEYFDIVFMLDVLEHIEDPINYLGAVRKYIRPGGYIYIEVDNIDDSLLTVYEVKEYADFYYREPHLFYFSPETLRGVVEKSGFIGETKTLQQYNFINQINWILTGEPQSSASDGMSAPVLVRSPQVPDETRAIFNKWIKKVDKEYKALLNSHNLGDITVFLGKKAT